MTAFFIMLLVVLWKFLTYPFEPLARFVCRKEKNEEKRDKKEFVCLLICLIVGYAILESPDMVYTYVMKHHESSEFWMGLYKNYNLIVHLFAVPDLYHFTDRRGYAGKNARHRCVFSYCTAGDPESAGRDRVVSDYRSYLAILQLRRFGIRIFADGDRAGAKR